MFLRTGLRFRHQAGADVEVKFNPWHDPDDGRFTFAGQGTNFGGAAGSGSIDGRGRSDRAKGDEPATGKGPRSKRVDVRAHIQDAETERDRYANSRDNPKNHSIYRVRRGDTLTKIARERSGLSPADLARFNKISPHDALGIGQIVKIPTQRVLDTERDARGVFRGLSYYMDTHGGRIPSGPGKLTDQLAAARAPTIVKNGYTYQRDGLFRPIDIGGELGHEKGRRSRQNQLAAGGPDRRKTDDGGHYVGIPFNGPDDDFNHFAQDRNFNRGAYRVHEAELKRYQDAGKQVYVRIVPSYRGASQRPYRLDYWWRIDGEWQHRMFENEKGGK